MFFFDTDNIAYSKIPDKIKERKMEVAKIAVAPFRLLMENGIKSGFFQEMDVKETLMLLTASMIGIISMFIHKGREDDLEEIRKYILRHTEIYLDGLKAH